VTDAQIITIAITVLAVLAGTLFSNARIGDLSARITDTNNALSARITDLKEVMRAELQKETGELRHLIERNREAILTGLSRIGQRVTRLEERIH
jgi:hypothetical protein